MPTHYRTRNDARMDTFDKVEQLYRPIRSHATLGYVSPIDFEQQASSSSELSINTMDNQHIAAIITALGTMLQAIGLYVVTPFLVYKLLRKPPDWFHSWKKGKAEIPGMKLEFERAATEETMAIAAGSSLQVTESPQEPERTKDPANTILEPQESRFWQAVELIQAQEYDRGLELIRQEAVEEADPEAAAEIKAIGHYFAYQAGRTGSLQDLWSLAESLSHYGHVRLWYARALLALGREQEALEQAEISLQSDLSSKRRAEAIVFRGQVLRSLHRFDEAIKFLEDSVNDFREPNERSDIYRALSKTYEERGDIYECLLFLELAVRDSSNDRSLHFDLAYKYLEAGVASLALFHYSHLIKLSDAGSGYFNNAGVSAERLGLPIKSVEYYKQAAAQSSSLAKSNLATRLLNAGFVLEARQELEEARALPEPDRRVATTIGDVARAEELEDNRLDELMKHSEDVVRLKRLEGRLRFEHHNDPSALGGTFSGVPNDVSVIVGTNSTITGEFTYEGKKASFAGKLVGMTARFSWETSNQNNSSLLPFLTKKSGHGLLIFDQDRITGFTTEASDLVAIDLKTFTEWSARRQHPKLLPSTT